MVDWPLTGRAEELELLVELLSGNTDYAGVVIAGRPGVGKTRLAREATAAAVKQGWIVRAVEGTAAAQAIPLGAFSRWINQIDDQPLNLVGSVIAAITASPDDARVLVTVDDAHLLDDLSAFVLHQLVRRGAATVIATLRIGERAPETVTALWKDGYLHRLDLQPLSHPDCDALLDTVLGGTLNAQSADRMWELTSGNVLFLHQLVKQERQAGKLIQGDGDRWQWTDPLTLSPTLADLVDVYIGAAPEHVVDVLDLLAVAEPLELEFLIALTEPAAVEDAERRDLIRITRTATTGDFVRIGHPLYAETRRTGMGQMRARRLRGRIARTMTAPGSGMTQLDPVRLSLLWLESDLPGDAGVHHRGSVAAFRRLDMALSERLAESAIRAGAGPESHVLRARTLTLLGRADDAEQLLNSLPAPDVPDALWADATTLRALNLLMAQGQPEQSWTVIDDALADAPVAITQELLAFRALQLAMAARPAEVLELVESIDRENLARRSAITLNFGHTIALGERGNPNQATQAPEDGFVFAPNSPVATYQAVALALVHADALMSNGCIHEALGMGERIRRQWADLPKVPQNITAAINGVAALAHGDLPAAQNLLSAALITDEANNNDDGLPYLGVGYWLSIALTEVLARAGQTDAAADALRQVQGGRHPSYAFIESNRVLAAAWVAAARGRMSEATTLVGEATDFARSRGQYAREVLCLQTALQFGDNQHCDRLAELGGLVEGPRALIVARWARARAADDGEALLDVSRDLETIGDRMAAADAAAHAALAFDHHNLRGSKLTASGRATHLITECGATTPATREVATPLPLSNREREIAALVRDGMSNKDIADTLTMSVRTVEGHIYRACIKLGVANRTELAGLIKQFTP
jgi:DNA-binding CsgD family transcriptional regulator